MAHFRVSELKIPNLQNGQKGFPTLLRVHEVDFGSTVPINDDKPNIFCASLIFGSGS